MKRIVLLLAILATIGTAFTQTERSSARPHPAENVAYLGFDRNNYPGDQNLKVLRQTFSYTGYWLNAPPSARTNTWSGKRQKLQSAGFGFWCCSMAGCLTI